MLRGTADVAALAAGAPEVEAFASEPVELGDATCLQLTVELGREGREEVLPPALHPTVPPVASIQAWDVRSSPWGAFAAAFVRVVCRSGARARVYCVGAAASTATACQALRAGYGFNARLADVALRRHYDDVRLSVRGGATQAGSPQGNSDTTRGGDDTAQGALALAVTGLNPDPLNASDLQHTAALTLAHTPLGTQLVQVETAHDTQRVERLSARIEAYDAAFFGEPLLSPCHVISCWVAEQAITLRPTRFVCDPTELAETGTRTL